MARMFKTPTKAQLTKMAKLQAVVSKAMDAIYEGNGGNVPFWTCHARASAKLQRDYEKAKDNVAILEQHLIAEGRGWLDGGGHFIAYSG